MLGGILTPIMNVALNSRSSSIVRRLSATLLLVFAGIHVAVPQAKEANKPNSMRRYEKRGPYYYGKASEVVVIQYEKLIREGALLTPQGWEKASKLFSHPSPYPKDGKILLTSTAALVGEISVNGDRATVETKWGDDYGSIDSALRYKPIEAAGSEPIYSILSGDEYQLVRNVSATGNASSVGEWKIDGPQLRHATPQSAIRYVTDMRDRSNDAVIKKNANKTLAVLQRLSQGCGRASAC